MLWPPGLELLFQNFPHSPRVAMSWSHSAHLEHLLCATASAQDVSMTGMSK